ncbi:MAG: carboxylesterase family protein [Pseudomonadota bacterium]|nr:carboxylesterase family protein [Pseudomonadota bacterium]
MPSRSRVSFIGSFIVLALATALTGAAGAAVGQEVVTASGRLLGSSDAGTTRYLGVPYALPPVGDLRWRDPRSAKPWTGVRSATRFAPACPQIGVAMPGEPPSPTDEDCLYLNIWTPDPAGQDGQSWPVIVWVPGGGLTNGSTSIPLYDGAALARRGVIVVTVAYRLGVLGFLAHPELTAESGMSGSGNYGLTDQIAALEWVRDNIAAFGGDPERVTVAGQSAGATSVSILLASPRARGLFQRAIGQSGGLFEPLALAPRYLLKNAEADGLAYGAALGAPTLAQLRSLPVERFVDGRGDVVVHPVIEPRVLPEPPHDVFAAGRHNDVPLLVGFNAEEARSLTDLSEVSAQNFQEHLTARWGALPPALLGPYPFATDAEAREARANFERDLRFGWDIRAWARLAAAHGQAPVHAYYFSRRPPYPEGSVQEAWGAGHFAELWYMFDHLDQQPWPWTEADRKLADAMSDYWVAFARDGDPNGHGRPIWPAFEAAEERVLLLDEDVEPGVLPNNAALDVFDAVYEAIR